MEEKGRPEWHNHDDPLWNDTTLIDIEATVPYTVHLACKTNTEGEKFTPDLAEWWPTCQYRNLWTLETAGHCSTWLRWNRLYASDMSTAIHLFLLFSNQNYTCLILNVWLCCMLLNAIIYSRISWCFNFALRDPAAINLFSWCASSQWSGPYTMMTCKECHVSSLFWGVYTWTLVLRKL